MTASICAELAFNSLAMVGIATLTMKASTPNMNCAATTIASTHQRRGESTCAETIWCMARRPYPTSVLPGLISSFGHTCDYLGGKLSRVLRPAKTGCVQQTKMQATSCTKCLGSPRHTIDPIETQCWRGVPGLCSTLFGEMRKKK